MESNSNDNYVLVLEDRAEVKSQQEAGKLTIVLGIASKGNLKTIEANYRQVKQEVLFLVSNEIDRIKATPNLAHLIKE